jgi:hypothetical protein
MQGVKLQINCGLVGRSNGFGVWGLEFGVREEQRLVLGRAELKIENGKLKMGKAFQGFQISNRKFQISTFAGGYI